MANLDSLERIWFDRRKFENAECKFAEHVASEHASLVVEVTIVTYTLVKFCFVKITKGVGVQLDPVSSGDASPPTISSSTSVKVSLFTLYYDFVHLCTRP